MIAKRGCNIETSVYTGNGIDPRRAAPTSF